MRMNSQTQIAIAIVACLSLANVARGESLFQRLPEPGQWCRYRTVQFSVVEGSAFSSPEQRGQLTVSALEIVEHNGVAHQWIEITNSIEVATADADEPDVVETMTARSCGSASRTT